MTYEGNLFGLLNPFALLCGLVSVAMLVMHGGAWLAVKTERAGREPGARSPSRYAAIALIVLFTLAGLWVGLRAHGYVGHERARRDGPSNPLLKTVARDAGGWLDNYARYPWMIARAAARLRRRRARRCLSARRRAGLAFLASGVGRRRRDRDRRPQPLSRSCCRRRSIRLSLTVWDASSSQLTLSIMLVATLIFLPIILAYTAWVYRVLRGRVTAGEIVREQLDSFY